MVTVVLLFAFVSAIAGTRSDSRPSPSIMGKEVEQLNTIGYGLMDLLSAEPTPCPSDLVSRTEISVLFCGAVSGAPPVVQLTAAIDKYLLSVHRARVLDAGWTEKQGASVRTYSIGGVLVTAQVIAKGHVVVMEYPMQCFPFNPIPEPQVEGEQWTNPKPVDHGVPRYPELARRARVEADVVLHAMILADGTIGETCLLYNSRPGLDFDTAAVEAVKKWRYEPARIGGEPATVPFVVRVSFRLH